jgi:hypothetical protein
MVIQPMLMTGARLGGSGESTFCSEEGSGHVTTVLPCPSMAPMNEFGVEQSMGQPKDPFATRIFNKKGD